MTEAAAAPANNQPIKGVLAAEDTPPVTAAAELALASAVLAVVNAAMAGMEEAIALNKVAPQLSQAEAPSFVILVMAPNVLPMAFNEST